MKPGQRVLTRRQRATCDLAWGAGQPLAQIAARHGITPAAVKKRLLRARQRLRAAGIEPPDGMARHGRRSYAFQLNRLENI